MDWTDRRKALLRSLVVFTAVQVLAATIVWFSYSEYVRGGLIARMLLGPLNVLGRLHLMKYHSILSNAGFLLFCATATLLPLIHWKRPGRITLALSAAGSLLWVLLGAGFSITHM